MKPKKGPVKKLKKFESRTLEVRSILNIHAGMHVIAREEYWNKSFLLFGNSTDDIKKIFDNLQKSYLHGIKFFVKRLIEEDNTKTSFKLTVLGHGDWTGDHFSVTIVNE